MEIVKINQDKACCIECGADTQADLLKIVDSIGVEVVGCRVCVAKAFLDKVRPAPVAE